MIPQGKRGLTKKKGEGGWWLGKRHHTVWHYTLGCDEYKCRHCNTLTYSLACSNSGFHTTAFHFTSTHEWYQADNQSLICLLVRNPYYTVDFLVSWLSFHPLHDRDFKMKAFMIVITFLFHFSCLLSLRYHPG